MIRIFLFSVEHYTIKTGIIKDYLLSISVSLNLCNPK